ncbi:MAG TPA: transposase, partial [Candidatus Binatia bacterium]
RGLVIVATSKITQRGTETWLVPSQSLNGKYAVTVTTEGKECTCPDFELRRQPCKHIFAVQYVLFREHVTETKPDGTVQTTTTEAASVRVTYGQPNWHAYNAAQTTEKDHFCRLLHDLVADVPALPQTGAGRRRAPLSDTLFAAAYKVYSGFSARRFMSDLRAAREQGLVSRAPAYNTLFDVMQLEEVTPILHELITATAKPLAALETQFAVDSTGLGTECFYRHYSAKYGHEQVKADYLKLHASIGTKTNVIAAVSITDRDGSDSPEFKPLAKKTAQDFNMEEMSADKAYSSYDNLELIESLGAKPFVPFKSNATAVAKSHRRPQSKTWTRLYHYFQLNREDFLEHYHRRSNAETTFSMLKRVIGDTLRSKTPVAQTNEALLMVIRGILGVRH